jgi:hypothetical protein
MRKDPRRPVAQLTAHELDLYGNQLTRCLKALGTPIHADVRRELATVRAEQESRAAGREPHHASRPYDVSGLTATELQGSMQTGREPGPGEARLAVSPTDPGAPQRHRRRAGRASSRPV